MLHYQPKNVELGLTSKKKLLFQGAVVRSTQVILRIQNFAKQPTFSCLVELTQKICRTNYCYLDQDFSELSKQAFCCLGRDF